jgi:hypothetical protein
MITREDFMVSVYDYNKDADDAERAEKAAAGGGSESSASQGSTASLAEKCLTDGGRAKLLRGYAAHHSCWLSAFHQSKRFYKVIPDF